jgi:biopolymer transport protein ExbB
VCEVQTAEHEALLLRCMSRVIGEESAWLENGQTLLASIAAVLPFVGLFGTVWGVHHALSAISMEGAASLAQIAAPVGEALIMTALGLAVTIPAVLAFNLFSRTNQVTLAQLDGFAHE